MLAHEKRLGFYPGGSLGNFAASAATRVLAQFRRLLGPGGKLLIGIDQPKEPSRLHSAYNDAAGVSEAFARNLLTRLNRELDATFDSTAFRYRARWVPEASHIEMSLVSRHPQKVQMAGHTWLFEEGEALITETSAKYDPEAFACLAQEAGWRCEQRWNDPNDDISLHLLV